jgi:hypothetical protein
MTTLTERLHVEVIDVEYIGKEANRWEEQFLLGETPDAQIEYGRQPDQQETLIAILTKVSPRRMAWRILRELRIYPASNCIPYCPEHLSPSVARSSDCARH